MVYGFYSLTTFKKSSAIDDWQESKYTSEMQHYLVPLTALHKKLKFSMKDFFSKCDRIHSKLQVWSHLLKKSLMGNFIFRAVLPHIIKKLVLKFLSFFITFIKSTIHGSHDSRTGVTVLARFVLHALCLK